MPGARAGRQAVIPVTRLIEELSRPEAYPHPAPRVEVIQTHISVVFLAGDWAYKLKKPLDLGFLDYSTLARRKACCEAEVRLNRRLAPGVYQGVEPVAWVEVGGERRLRVGAAGAPVEFAVKMRRLPDERTLEALIAGDTVTAADLTRIGARLARFHAEARGGPEVATFGRFEVVAGNCRENFAQTRPGIGHTVSAEVHRALAARTEDELAARRALIEARAAEGVPRDTHGDLRLDHVYLFPDAPPPGDLLVVDCIEFNERFRYADPVADLAFLVMDLHKADRPDLARALVEGYFAHADDPAGRALLPLYSAYRATVRAKVEGFRSTEPEVPARDRARARTLSRAHFLLALGLLAPPRDRPCLVLATGLPGTGKSHLARRLCLAANLVWIRSDAVRKELAGAAEASHAAGFGQGIYTPAWTERTYATCLARAEAAWSEGRRVLVDATFVRESRRRTFLDAARRWSVPARVLHLVAPPDVIRDRLARREGDPSDADWGVYQRLRDAWEPPAEATAARVVRIAADLSEAEVLAQAEAALTAAGLL